ncbi:MAG: hypothetical protein Q7S57_01570 [bacterium]|nr:hypothetical protein [bacterium]
MNTRSVIDFANTADDEAMRNILRRTPMPGDISLAFLREPSFFAVGKIGNEKNQTIVCRAGVAGDVVGFACRSVRNLYVDGEKKAIGYLNMLRLLPEFRGGMTLAKAHRHLRTLHEDGEVPYYLTTILEENGRFQSVLQRPRAGHPVYHQIGTLVTYLIPIKKRNMCGKVDVDVQKCPYHQLPLAHKCLERWNQRYQFAPTYRFEEIFVKNDFSLGFSSDDLLVCESRGRILGTFGVWNQQSFKQTVVTGLSCRLSLLRPFLNCNSRLLGKPIIPKIGGEVKTLSACFMSSEDDDRGVFESLLSRACQIWSGRGHDYLCVALCVGNGLSGIASKYACRQLRSNIYLVYWADSGVDLPCLKTSHLELATL